MAILGNVERIGHEALAIGRILTGQDSRLVAPIRLTAVETLMAGVLPPRVDDPSQLRRRRLARSMMRPERGIGHVQHPRAVDPCRNFRP